MHCLSQSTELVSRCVQVHVSYLEIYNEQLYDLLAENPGDSNGMAVQEDPTKGAFVSECALVEQGNDLIASELASKAIFCLEEQAPLMCLAWHP